MKFSLATKKYIEERMRVGLSCKSSGYLLKQFERMNGDKELSNITEDEIFKFVYSGKVSEKTHFSRFSIIRGLYKWAVNRGTVQSSPIVSDGPKSTCVFIPYIYTREELKKLFASAGTLNDRSSPMQGDTMKAVLVTLYACGLRLSEALNIRLCDIDLNSQRLTILETKFKKSRILPFGDELCAFISKYYRMRCKHLPLPYGQKSHLFVSRTGHQFSKNHISHMFERIRKLADIYVPERKQQPRLHDLRHTFAVHKLMELYNSGKEVNKLIHELSTYLGHKDLEDTKVYLSMTKEFLEIVSQKFEIFANQEKENHEK